MFTLYLAADTSSLIPFLLTGSPQHEQEVRRRGGVVAVVVVVVEILQSPPTTATPPQVLLPLVQWLSPA